MPTTPLANGNANSFFIAEVRRILRDQAAWFTDSIPTDGTNGVVNVAGSKPFRLQRAPIVTAGAVVTAPPAVNSGITTWTPTYNATDAAPPAPSISDAGVTGTLAAGTYQAWYTYVYPGGETIPGPLSTALTIVAGHGIQTATIAVTPATATAIRTYLLPTTGAASIGGFLVQDAIAGSYGGRIFNAPANGTGVVGIVPDTGEVIFPAAPTSGTLSATYQTFRYSDTQIVDALTEGLKSLWPQIWQEQSDTSLTPTPYAFEYTLPVIFNDPRVEILRIEIRDPNVIVIPYRQVERYDRVSQNTIQLTDLRYSPAGNIRISYNAPYGALSDTEPQVQHLPVYYALGRLLADQEAMRSRQDELVPLVGEGGSQSGVAQQTSTYWFSLYEREKQRFARPLPLRSLKQFEGWSYGSKVPWKTSL
jgi:hypothetical protein